LYCIVLYTNASAHLVQYRTSVKAVWKKSQKTMQERICERDEFYESREDYNPAISAQ